MWIFSDCFQAKINFLTTLTCTICRGVWHLTNKFHLYLIFVSGWGKTRIWKSWPNPVQTGIRFHSSRIEGHGKLNLINDFTLQELRVTVSYPVSLVINNWLFILLANVFYFYLFLFIGPSLSYIRATGELRDMGICLLE